MSDLTRVYPIIYMLGPDAVYILAIARLRQGPISSSLWKNQLDGGLVASTLTLKSSGIALIIFDARAKVKP